MPYTYTQKNLLHEPNSYMYSEYRGRNLIDDYYENRIHLLEGLYAPQKDRFSVIDFHLQEKVRQLVSNNKISDLELISLFLAPDCCPFIIKTSLIYSSDFKRR